MPKSIFASVQPYWVFLIIAKAMGWNIDKEKTVEVRKNYPRANDWDKTVKIYCGKDKKSFARIPKEYQPLMQQFLGKVIGEFVCDKIDEYRAEFCDFEHSDCTSKKCALNQILKVVGYDDYDATPLYQFESSNEEDNPDGCELVKNSNVAFNEIRNYIGETFFDKPFYGLHISNLIIYDKPKELGEFKKINRDCRYADLGLAKRDCPECQNKECFLARPPQSWCYVEMVGEG